LGQFPELKPRETVIYLDDSFSMQAKTEEGSLLETAVQDLVKTLPQDGEFSIFTNETEFKNVRISDIQNDLLTLKYSQKQLRLEQIGLKASALFNSETGSTKDLLIISDFQRRMGVGDPIEGVQQHVVQLLPESEINVSVDSAYVNDNSVNSLELTVKLTANATIESIPVSLYNKEKLIAKTAAAFDERRQAEVVFTLPANEVIDGRIEISDTGLAYDNQLFFRVGAQDKIKVLAIGSADSDFLRRIYTPDEFEYTAFGLNELNYSLLPRQNLIILNELEILPTALQNAVGSFINDGGSLIIIPGLNADLNSYNAVLRNFYATSFVARSDTEQNLTSISFAHPIYNKAFVKEVSNFQYPLVKSHYTVRSAAPSALRLQSGDAFLLGSDSIYLFTAALNGTNSNFKGSPLIVPTFYSIGIGSLKLPQLYYEMDQINQIDLPVTVGSDRILSVSRDNYEFIPRQQSFSNKTSMVFEEDPKEDGIYDIKEGADVHSRISFNYSRNESDLAYMNTDSLEVGKRGNTVENLLRQIEKENEVSSLWKWFVILALIFILTEVLIQKFFR
ncbi:MAG: hypothetical protein AAF361_08435, partial [Bacteroidota bacterium]